MSAQDLPFVLAIERLSFTHPWPESSFIGEMENVHISYPYVIMHRLQNKVIGYIIFWHLGEEAQISNFSIHPDYQRRGVGHAVLSKVLTMLSKLKIKHIVLEVRPSNLAARSLYNRFGFKTMGVKKNYYVDPVEDALIMGKYMADYDQ